MPIVLRNMLRALLAGALLVGSAQMQAAGPLPLEAYGDLPAVEDAALSPRGDKIAVVATVQGKRRLLLTDGARNLVNQSEIGDLKVRSIEWIGEDAVLVTYSETETLGPGFTADRFESVRSLIVPSTPGRKVDSVFAKNRSIVGSIFRRYGLRQVDGRWMGYFGGIQLDRSGNDVYLGTTAPSLFEVDMLDNEASEIAKPPVTGRMWRDWLVDGQGRVAVTFDMNTVNGEWTIKDARMRTIASGRNPSGDADLVTLGSDGTTVIYSVGDADSEAERWFELPLAGAAEPKEVFADIEIDSIYGDDTSGRLIGYESAGQRHFFDPATQKMSDKIVQAFKNLDADLIDWTGDFRRVLVRTSGNGDSGSWYLVNLDTLRADQIGLERPLIAPEQVGPVSSFAYSAGDGLELDGILTLPPGREAKNLPVVVLPHGGPSSHDEVSFDWWAQAFASRGYAVFQPNFRGSTNRDEAFRRAGYGEWGRKMQSDISDGLAALAKAGTIDAERACIMGASYGGYAALAGVTLQQGIYRCAVAVAPVSDPQLMLDTDVRESGRSKVVKAALLEQLGERSLLDEVSPRRFAARADAPILLIHGQDDVVVPYKQSTIMADALKDSGKPHKLVQLREEDHWLSRAATRKQMLAEAMAFVLEHNPPE